MQVGWVTANCNSNAFGTIQLHAFRNAKKSNRVVPQVGGRDWSGNVTEVDRVRAARARGRMAASCVPA